MTNIKCSTCQGTVSEGAIKPAKIKVMVPEGTQTGTKLRCREKGIPYTNSHTRGDLYVQVILENLNPKNLTQKQFELLKALEEEEHESVEQISEGFFGKVKKMRNLLNNIKR